MKQLKGFLLTAVTALSMTASTIGFTAGGNVDLESAPIDLSDKESLRNGARYFMNYCHSCHALGLSRYNRTATDMGIVMDADQAVADGISPDQAALLVDANAKVVTDTMIFTRDEEGKPSKIGGLMENAMPAKDAAVWFGAAPPDLSLVGRSRGGDWIYTYLKGFYLDPSKPTGMNNKVFKDVAMPHVLWKLQGLQKKDSEGYLYVDQPGTMSEEEYDKVAGDLANFLVYVGEPAKLHRTQYGIFVMIFLLIFFVLAYMLKKEYWKDVH